MLKKHFKKIIYLLLFPLFFILHGHNAYFGLIPFEVLFSLLIKYVLIALLLITISFSLYKNGINAFLFILFLLCVFFLFGPFHDWLKTILPNSKLTSYSSVLPALAAMVIGLFWYLKRSRRNFQRLFLYSKLLLIFFVSMEVVSLLFQIFTSQTENNHLAVPINELKPTTIPNENKPDIFFVVFDEYASSKSLREDFNFDNSGIDSLFEANKFFVSYDSKSNYNFTFFSIASTFALDYLKLKPDGPISERLTLQGIKSVEKNYLTAYLKKQKYQILNYGSFNLNEEPAKTTPFFDNGFISNVIDNQTLYSRIKRDIWWNFTLKNIFTGEWRIPNGFKKAKDYHVQRNNFNLNGLINELRRETLEPRFVYVHLMLPHEPFYLNSDGKPLSDTVLIRNTINQRDGYLDQLKFSNSLIREICAWVNYKTKRKRVVVIESDHGYKFFDESKRNRKFWNLNAYYFSDNEYSKLYNGISPVNTFRVILNQYFNQSFPLLKDSSIYILDSNVKNN